MSYALSFASKNKKLIEKINNEITEVLLNQKTHMYQCGFLNGLSGYLLFFYRMNKYDEKLKRSSLISENVINSRLDFLQDNLAYSKGALGFGSGLSGQGWLLEYLNQEDQISYDENFCEDIDDILIKSLSPNKWQGELEMVLGLAGISIYASRRLKKSKNIELYSKIIGHYELTATAVKEELITWLQPRDSVFRYEKDDLSKGEINLGLAHGVPGIISAILPALKIKTLEVRVRTLLLKSCNWLIKQESTKPNRTSCFSTLSEDLEGTRLGWCYGDLTIALTLARVGNELNHSIFIDKAREFSLHAALRNAENSMVTDAGICHGSAGLSLIFQLLYKELGNIELLNAANTWLNYTLELYKASGLEGLYKFSGESQNYEEDTSLLMGYCGIGLSLLSALGEDDNWVDCLLMA